MVLISSRTLSRTSLLFRSHRFPVAGSSRVRSRLHPGLMVIPLYDLTAASCAMRGCENISDTSLSLAPYMWSAPFIVSSILMSSASLSLRLSSESLVLPTMQSSMIFPVLRLLMVLLCTSCIGGPFFVVVSSRVAFMNVFANTPDPMFFHSKSPFAYLPPLCICPG